MPIQNGYLLSWGLREVKNADEQLLLMLPTITEGGEVIYAQEEYRLVVGGVYLAVGSDDIHDENCELA